MPKRAKDAKIDLLVAALDHMRHGVLIHDQNLTILHINALARDLIRITEDDAAIGESMEKLIRANAEHGGYGGEGSVEERIEKRLRQARNFTPFYEERPTHYGTYIEVRGQPIGDDGFVITYTDITRRVRTEASARRSERRFQDFVASSSDWLWEIDEDLRFTFVSNRAVEVLGFDPELLIGKRPWDDLPEEQLNENWLAVIDAIENHKPFRNFEYETINAKGRTKWISVSGIPIFDDDLRFQGFRGTGTDITERETTRKALTESEERFRSFAETMSDWLWETDPDSRFTYISENSEEVLGVAASDVIGKSRLEVHGPDYLSDAWKELRDAIAARKPFNDFQYLRHRANQYVSLSGIPLFDGNGEFLGYRGTGTDVTEQRQARDALARSENKFRDFAEVASDWLWEMDADLRFTFISSKFEELTGMGTNDVIGKTREETAGIQYSTDLWNPVKDAVAQRKPFRNFEYRRVWPDGTERDFSISGIPIFDNDGAFAGYRGTGSDITEKKKTETELARSEQRFRGFAETMSDWLWEIDTEERFTYISENAEDILGIPRDQVLGKSRYDIHGDHYLSDNWKPVRDAIKNRQPFQNFQYRRYRVDRYMSLTGAPIFDQDGVYVGFRGTGTDITQQRKAEIALEESEKRFRGFAETASDWFFELDEKVRVTFVSENAETITGIPATKLIGRTAAEVIGDVYITDEWRQYREAVDNRKPFRDFRYRAGFNQGPTKIISLSALPLFDDNGDFKGYRGTGADVTEQQAVFDRATLTEQQLRTAIDSLPDGFAVFDEDDVLLMCNERFREIYWQSADLLVPGKVFRDMIAEGLRRGQYPDGIGREEEYLENRLKLRERGATNIEQRLPDGRWVRLTDRRTPSGGMVSHRVDITELKTAVEVAEHANQAKSQFLATTPMSGVMGFADMLLEDDLPNESREKVYRIKDATHALLAIINDILDVSKLEAGKMEIEKIDFLLPQLIDSVVSLFQEKRQDARRKALHLSVSIADDCPGAINSDPMRLRQILVNLIGNAVKFTTDGTVDVSATRATNGDGREMLRFDITDTGIGIAPDVIANLFQDFSQADASISRQFEGTGLGLAICRRLVELMGGDIWVESELEKGSTFSFTLPLVEAVQDASDLTFERASATVSLTPNRQLDILVAEDNKLNQRIISATLDSFGHHYKIVGNGRDAVQALSENDFDLVLMDVRMPEMSGPDATRMIRKLGNGKADIAIIALTADVTEDHQSQYSQAGMDGVVAKPIDRQALASAINAALKEEIFTPQEIASPDCASSHGSEDADTDAAALAAVEDFFAELDSLAGNGKSSD